MSAFSVLLVLFKYQQYHHQFVLLMLGLVSWAFENIDFGWCFWCHIKNIINAFCNYILSKGCCVSISFQSTPNTVNVTLAMTCSKKVPTQRFSYQCYLTKSKSLFELRSSTIREKPIVLKMFDIIFHMIH